MSKTLRYVFWKEIVKSWASSCLLGPFCNALLHQQSLVVLGCLSVRSYSGFKFVFDGLVIHFEKTVSFIFFLADELELTWINRPRDKFFDWFIGPLLTMKEQIRGLKLEENEEICLKKLIMACKNDRPEEWDDTGFPSSDNVRKAQLQAVIRRLVQDDYIFFISVYCTSFICTFHLCSTFSYYWSTVSLLRLSNDLFLPILAIWIPSNSAPVHV